MGCRRASRKAVENARRMFSFSFFFSFFARNKRKVPSSPRPPHIFNTRFVLHFFSLFFLSSFVTTIPARTSALRKASRHAHACFMTVITLFSLSLSLSLLSHYHNHHPIRLLVLSLCIFLNHFADKRSIEM